MLRAVRLDPSHRAADSRRVQNPRAATGHTPSTFHVKHTQPSRLRADVRDQACRSEHWRTGLAHRPTQ